MRIHVICTFHLYSMIQISTLHFYICNVYIFDESLSKKVDLILQSLNDPDVASMQVCKYALLQWPPEQAYPSTVTKFPAVSLVTIGCSALTLKHQIYLFLFFFDQIHLFLYFSAKYIWWLSTFISLCRINRMFLHCIDLFENLLSFNSCAHCVVFWK